MNDTEMNNSESDTLKALKAELELLKAELQRSEIKVEVVSEIAAGLRRQLGQSQDHIAWLDARNKELENPKPHYEKLGWLGKIVFIIRKMGRPLRCQEIMTELGTMDKSEKALNRSWNPDKLISTVLAKGVKDKRIHLFKVPGTRGAYYAVEEWVDEKGNLDDDLLYELM